MAPVWDPLQTTGNADAVTAAGDDSDHADSPAGAQVQPDNSYSPQVINLITHLPDLEI